MSKKRGSICIISLFFILLISNVFAVDYASEYSNSYNEFQDYQTSYEGMNVAFSNCQTMIVPGDVNSVCFSQIESFHDTSVSVLNNNLKDLKSNINGIKASYLSEGGKQTDNLYNQFAALGADAGALMDALTELDSNFLTFLNTQKIIHDQGILSGYQTQYTSLDSNLDSVVSSKNKATATSLVSQLQNLLSNVNNLKDDVDDICDQTDVSQCNSVKQSLSSLSSSLISSISSGQVFLNSSEDKPEEDQLPKTNTTNNSNNNSSNYNSSSYTGYKLVFKESEKDSNTSTTIYNKTNSLVSSVVGNKTGTAKVFTFDLKNLNNNNSVKVNEKSDVITETVVSEPVSIVIFLVVGVIILIGLAWFFRLKAKLN